MWREALSSVKRSMLVSVLVVGTILTQITRPEWQRTKPSGRRRGQKVIPKSRKETSEERTAADTRTCLPGSRATRNNFCLVSHPGCGMLVCLCLKDQRWPTKTNISKVWQKEDELLASVMWLWRVLPLPAEDWEPLFLAGCSKRPTLISCHTVFFPGQLSPWQAKARRILYVPTFGTELFHLLVTFITGWVFLSENLGARSISDIRFSSDFEVFL